MSCFSKCFALSLGLVGALLADPARSETQTIDGDAALRAALSAGVHKQELLLAPGVYGPVTMSKKSAPAVIRSADPANPAVLKGLQVSDFEDLTIQNVVFGYAFDPADKINVRPFQFSNCKGLKLLNSRIEGELAHDTGTNADGHGYGIGLSVRFCADVVIQNNFIQHHHRGLIVSESSNIVVRNNEVTQLRMDGMTFAQVKNINIEDNFIHSFERVLDSKDHADMIQFWTASTQEPSTSIVIRANVLNSGSGAFTQSIFMRNELVDKGKAGDEMFYRDILIEDNIIINAHLHGITVGETRGLTIRNNTLVQNPASAGDKSGDRVWVPSIRLSDQSEDVTVTGNITGDLRGAEQRPGWQVKDNLIVQNTARGEAGHYSRVFSGWPAGSPIAPDTYRLRPDMPAIGSALLRR